MHLAAEEGHQHIVEYLYDELGQLYFIETVDEDLRTVLHWAAWKRQLSVSKSIPRIGFNLFFTTSVPHPFISSVTFLKDNFLHGSKLFTKQTRAGFTGLHYTGTNGGQKIAEILLQAGCKPDVRDGIGQTPADVARRFGHQSLAEFFDQAVISEEKPESDNGNPSHLALPNLSPRAGPKRAATSSGSLQNQTLVYVLVGVTIGVLITQFLTKRSASNS